MLPYRKLNLQLLIAVSWLPVAGLGNDLPPLPEQVFPTLNAALEQALQQSPRMLLKQLDLEMASGDLLQAKSSLYPSIGGYYQKSETKDEREDIPGVTIDTSKTYYSLSLTQPIFHWGERLNTAKIGKIRSKIAEKQFAEAYRVLAYEVRNAYLSLVSYKGQLVNARFNRELADEALKSGEERVAGKLMAEGDIFRLRISAEQAALSEETLEAGFIAAKELYEALTGADAPADELIPDTIPAQNYYPPTYENLIADFLNQKDPETPSLEIMREQIAVDTLSYKNARKRLLPKVNLLLGVSQDEQSYTINNAQKYGVSSRYAGVQVSWSIFDGFVTRGAVRSALAQRRQHQQNYRINVEAQQRQAQATVRAIGLAYRQMAISDRMLDNSQQYLKYRQDDFKIGQASEADVNQALLNYYSALVSANTSRINFLLKGTELVSLVARDPVMESVDFN